MYVFGWGPPVGCLLLGGLPFIFIYSSALCVSWLSQLFLLFLLPPSAGGSRLFLLLRLIVGFFGI